MALQRLGVHGREITPAEAKAIVPALRVGELASLRLEHVDLRARRIRVLHGKGDRTIVLPPRLAPILAAYLRDVRPQLVARRLKSRLAVIVSRPPPICSSTPGSGEPARRC